MKRWSILVPACLALVAPGQAAAFDDGTPQEYYVLSQPTPPAPPVKYTLHQFKGTHVELLLPDSWLPENGGLSVDERRILLDRADILYQYYSELLGWEPRQSDTRPHVGLFRMAVVPLAGLNGLAPFGWKEMEIGEHMLATFKTDIQDGFETQRSVLVHEMAHAFDRYWQYLRYDTTCNSGDPPNWCHAWTNFFDGYIPFYGRFSGVREPILGGDRTADEHEAKWTDHTYRPYYDQLFDVDINWENCVRTEGCLSEGITVRDTWAGVTHRWAELYGVEAVQRAMDWLSSYAASNPSPTLDAEEAAHRHVLMLAAGAQANLTCFLEEWKWYTSPELEQEMEVLYGPASSNPMCLDYDLDGYSPLQGDCRDSNASVYPGAPEVSNGIDDDCNRYVDDVTPPTPPVLPLDPWGEVFPPEKDGVDFVLRSSMLTLDAPIVLETPSWVRFWVTGYGVVGYVPYSADATLDWTPPAGLPAGTYGYRAQLMSYTKPVSDWTDIEWFDYDGPCSDDLDCDDGNDCTVDSCTPEGLCSNVALQDDVYEAETMTHSTGNEYEQGWNIYSNGYASFTHGFVGGWQQITVRAAGQNGNGWPNMRVTIGGALYFERLVDSAAWTDYTFWVNRPAGSAEVRVNFTNDYFFDPPIGETIDRNLLLDKVTVLAQCGPAEPPTPINLGPQHAERTFTASGAQGLVVDQLSIGWTPARIVVGFGHTDGVPLNGVSVSVNGAAPISLSGNWQTISIPFTGQSSISLTVYSATPRALRTQWWAEG